MVKEVFGTIDGEMSLIERIAALHTLYHKYRTEILWFGQLVGHCPGVIANLTKDSIHNRHEMV